MTMDVNGVLRTHFVKALARRVCGDEVDVIKRPASFVLKRKEEKGRDVERLIILPPKGYTADAFNQTNSHDEAERATIEIKGSVREGKHGYSKLHQCLLVAAFHRKSLVSTLDKPYQPFELGKNRTPGLSTDFHSAGEPPFTVVKANGYGFYHNLINTTDDWMVLHLRKRMRPQKSMDLAPVLDALPSEYAASLQRLCDAVMAEGDGVFRQRQELVDDVLGIPPELSLPALGEMLHVYDTGRHEACSVFAIILKISRVNPEAVAGYIETALAANAIPEYYAKQLLEKIRGSRSPDSSIGKPGPG